MIKFGELVLVLCLLALPVKAADVLLVSEDDIAQAVKNEFVEQGVQDEVEVEFFGGQTVFGIENAKQSKILIDALKLDELNNKFIADVEIFADGKAYAKTTLQGKYYVVGEVWVPAHNIAKDEVITADMLKTIKVRMNRIKSMNITDKDKIIDKQAKKSLKEGKLINDRDIGQVMLVKKGDIMVSIYSRKGLQITAKVQAMEDGALNQKIEVMNTKSEKKFFGTVVDANTVEIGGDF